MRHFSRPNQVDRVKILIDISSLSEYSKFVCIIHTAVDKISTDREQHVGLWRQLSLLF